jgi:hypothetical protein
MGDTCCLPFSMGAVKKEIEKSLPGVYVVSIMVSLFSYRVEFLSLHSVYIWYSWARTQKQTNWKGSLATSTTRLMEYVLSFVQTLNWPEASTP